MSIRIQQAESTLQRAIAQVLQRGPADPRISGLVSVTQVKLSPDRREAYVSVSILPEEHQRRVLAGLRHAAGHIQSQLRGLVAMRSVPRLDFRLDESLKKQAEVFEALRRAEQRTDMDSQD